MNFCFLNTLRTNSLALVGILAVFLSITNVQANMVTFQFEGELTQVDSPLSGTFSTGDKFNGTYTFDSTSVGTIGVGDKFYENAVSEMTFTTGTYTASAKNGLIDYFDAIDPDAFEIDTPLDIGEGIFVNSASSLISGASVNGKDPTRISLNWLLSDGVPSFLTSDHPFVDPYFDPDQQPEAFARFDLLFDFLIPETGSFGRIKGNLTSVTVVPIPATLWLFATGLLGLIRFTARNTTA